MGESEDELRDRLVRLIVAASEGTFTADELLSAGGRLAAFNYSSLSYIRLIDEIENDIGVYVDPEADVERFATVDSILALIAESDGAGG